MTAAKPFIPLDEKFPLNRQLGVEAAPLVLINLFTVVHLFQCKGCVESTSATAKTRSRNSRSFRGCSKCSATTRWWA